MQANIDPIVTPSFQERRKHLLQSGLALLGILALGLLLRAVYACYLCNVDSYAYILGARRLLDKGLFHFLGSLGNIYENRSSIVFPLAGFLALFGFTELTIAAWALTYSLGAVVCVYLLGNELFGVRAGYLAALIVAIMPLDSYFGSAILPDNVIPLYVGLALLTFLWALERENSLYYVLCGFFVFSAFQARATSAIILPAFFLIALWRPHKRLEALVIPTVSFVLCNLLLWTAIALSGGSIFSQINLWVTDATMPDFVGSGPLLGYFTKVVRLDTGFGMFYLLAFPAWFVLLVLARRWVTYRIPLILFAVVYLYFEFGSTTILRYEPIWKYDRFLTILSIPAALTLAAVSIWLFTNSGRWSRLALFALFCGAMFLPIGQMLQVSVALDDWGYDPTYAETFEWLSQEQTQGIVGVVHPRWELRGKVHGPLNQGSYDVVDLRGFALDDIRPGMTIIYDPYFFTDEIGWNSPLEAYPAFERLPQQVPEQWQQVAEFEREGLSDYPITVYKVGAN